jgi:hypothetical protein
MHLSQCESNKCRVSEETQLRPQPKEQSPSLYLLMPLLSSISRKSSPLLVAVRTFVCLETEWFKLYWWADVTWPFGYALKQQVRAGGLSHCLHLPNSGTAHPGIRFWTCLSESNGLCSFYHQLYLERKLLHLRQREAREQEHVLAPISWRHLQTFFADWCAVHSTTLYLRNTEC